MKKSLADKNYYNKEYWTVPYSQTEKYSFIGHVGVAFLSVDVYVDGVFNRTLETNAYGEFEFLYAVELHPTQLHFQARTKDSLYFTGASAPLQVQGNIIYSWFAAISTQMNSLRTQQQQLRSYIGIDTCPTEELNRIYSPYVGFERFADELSDSFRMFVKSAFQIYNGIGYEDGLGSFKNLLEQRIDGIDHIDIYTKASYEEGAVSGMTSFIYPYDGEGLTRTKYVYRITACRRGVWVTLRKRLQELRLLSTPGAGQLITIKVRLC
jgi:hypothetical protein